MRLERKRRFLLSMTNNLKKAKTWFLIAVVVLVIGLASLPSFTSNANATQYTDESSGSAGYFAECSSQCGSSEVTFMRGGWTVPTLSCQPRENASASYS